MEDRSLKIFHGQSTQTCWVTNSRYISWRQGRPPCPPLHQLSFCGPYCTFPLNLLYCRIIKTQHRCWHSMMGMAKVWNSDGTSYCWCTHEIEGVSGPPASILLCDIQTNPFIKIFANRNSFFSLFRLSCLAIWFSGWLDFPLCPHSWTSALFEGSHLVS